MKFLKHKLKCINIFDDVLLTYQLKTAQIDSLDQFIQMWIDSKRETSISSPTLLYSAVKSSSNVFLYWCFVHFEQIKHQTRPCRAATLCLCETEQVCAWKRIGGVLMLPSNALCGGALKESIQALVRYKSVRKTQVVSHDCLVCWRETRSGNKMRENLKK